MQSSFSIQNVRNSASNTQGMQKPIKCRPTEWKPRTALHSTLPLPRAFLLSHTSEHRTAESLQKRHRHAVSGGAEWIVMESDEPGVRRVMSRGKIFRILNTTKPMPPSRKNSKINSQLECAKQAHKLHKDAMK